MTYEEFRTERTNIISRMLDNPDKYGIYPTSICFDELDKVYRKVIKDEREANIKEFNLYMDLDGYSFKQLEENIRRRGVKWVK